MDGYQRYKQSQEYADFLARTRNEEEMWGTELHPEDITTRYLGLPWLRHWRD